MELTQVRQEIERRIAEKEEEFLSTKKNFQKAIDGMQTALETESKGKAEALRMKKKLEADVNELEVALEHANAANQETQKAIKRYHQNIRDAQTKLEDEQRTKEIVRDELLGAERRANSNQNALEEARTLLEQADRSRRMTEQELSDTNEQLSDLTCTNQAIAGAKRKLESEMQTLHVSFTMFIQCFIFFLTLLNQFRLTWMKWPVRLISLKRKPRKPWLMLLVLLMS